VPASPDSVRRQLERILGSRAFANAERLRSFLRFVVEETLAERGDALKEYAIAREVCGRPTGFDPKQDPIVRVDANRLRTRLDAYYASEGAADPVRIELPKGAYVPVFTGAPDPAVPARQQTCLAVLPLATLGGSGEQEYFGDSLTEELIHSLSKISGLRVIGRSSAFQFKGRGEDARSVGRRLGVDYVLEGSVRVSGGRLRITAQLVDVAQGWLLWSEKYECPWAGVFSVQDEITGSITDALRIHLTAETAPTVFTHATQDADAYADYLRGRYYCNQRTAEGLARSIQCHERALERDSRCAPAYAGIADALLVMAINDQAPTLSLMPRARAAAHKALELRPAYPDALVSLGCVKSIFDWDWEGGARDLEEAARRHPGSAAVHGMFGVFNLQARGMWDEAVSRMRMALRLDPVSHVLVRDLGLIHYMRRAWDEAEHAWRQAEELAPGYQGCVFWRAWMAIETGHAEQAIPVLEARWAAGPANTRVLATLAYAWARLGQPAKAREILADLEQRARKGRVPPLNFAIVRLGLEEHDLALDCLEQACEERAAALYQFAVDPIYDPIRSHPRAEAMRLAMRLPITSR
jgi:TolB-like protein/Tfp pilus assembly protein PilF